MLRITGFLDDKSKTLGKLTLGHAFRPDTFRSRKLAVGRHQPFVKFESIFPHRKMNRVLARLLDIEVDLVGLAAMLFFGALLAVPTPVLLSLAPLQALTAVGPLPVKTNMQPVVFRTGGMGAHPNVIASRRCDRNLVVKNRHLARLRRKVFPMNQFVTMRATRIGKDLQVSSAAGSSDV